MSTSTDQDFFNRDFLESQKPHFHYKTIHNKNQYHWTIEEQEKVRTVKSFNILKHADKQTLDHFFAETLMDDQDRCDSKIVPLKLVEIKMTESDFRQKAEVSLNILKRKLPSTCTKIIFEVILDNSTAENEVMTNVEHSSPNINNDAMSISGEGNISNEYTHVTDEPTLPKYKDKGKGKGKGKSSSRITKDPTANNPSDTPIPIVISNETNVQVIESNQGVLDNSTIAGTEILNDKNESVTNSHDNNDDIMNNSAGGNVINSNGYRSRSTNVQMGPVVEVVNKSVRYLCSICNIDFADLNGSNRHWNIEHEKLQRRYCVFCESSYWRQKDLDIHYKNKHKSNMLRKCRICQIQFKQIEKLQTHFDEQHASKAYQCKICKKMFGKLAHRNRHAEKCCKVT